MARQRATARAAPARSAAAGGTAGFHSDSGDSDSDSGDSSGDSGDESGGGRHPKLDSDSAKQLLRAYVKNSLDGVRRGQRAQYYECVTLPPSPPRAISRTPRPHRSLTALLRPPLSTIPPRFSQSLSRPTRTSPPRFSSLQRSLHCSLTSMAPRATLTAHPRALSRSVAPSPALHRAPTTSAPPRFLHSQPPNL